MFKFSQFVDPDRLHLLQHLLSIYQNMMEQIRKVENMKCPFKSSLLLYMWVFRLPPYWYLLCVFYVRCYVCQDVLNVLTGRY